MKEDRIIFPSGQLTLEGLIAKPENCVRGAVVCHPHPLYGGSMYNNVVDAALEAMWRLGWATLRFNFRGVGQSEGEHGGGIGEADDAIAAIKYLTEQSRINPKAAVLAGYSFGAMAALSALPKINELAAVLLIALPIGRFDAEPLTQFPGPVLLVAGDNDSYCPAPPLQALEKQLAPRAQLKIIEGADHFFGGYDEELADALETMLKLI